MAVEKIIESWKEVRAGLIDEAKQIPADQFSFRATPAGRSKDCSNIWLRPRSF